MWDYGIVHFLVLTPSIWFFGVWLGLLNTILINFFFDKILESFGYRRLTFTDLCMTFEKEGTNHNIGGYFEIDKLGYDEFKEQLYERGIKHIPKMSSILVSHFGFRLWKRVSLEIAKEQVLLVDKDIKTDRQ
jgi:hypothetical protein